MTTLAYNLKRIRKEKRLSQEALADKIGVKRTTYARYEDDIEAPQDVLEKIHKILKVEYLEFRKPIPENYTRAIKKNIVLPQTVEELIELYKKVIAALERELAVKDKYIALLESRIK